LYKSNLIDIKYLIISPALLLLPLIFELYRKKENPLINIAYTSLAIVYITIPFSLMNFLVFPKINNYEYSYQLIFGLFFLIWTFDSGAYFTGSLIGKHKLFKRISPKKTWEGVIGGYIFSIGMSYIMFLIFGTLKIHEWLIVSFIISTTSIFGDLAESMLKRSFNIKDSGKIMPGHGGILDRIDSSLFSVPVVVIYLFLFDII
jgi:phosphatidate cytidylyltransferase